MKPPEPIVFYCSCGDDIGPFTVYRSQMAICSECGTNYTLGSDGILRNGGRLRIPITRDFDIEKTDSYPLRVEWPA